MLKDLCQNTYDIYFHTQELCLSVEKRKVHLITISSFSGILNEYED